MLAEVLTEVEIGQRPRRQVLPIHAGGFEKIGFAATLLALGLESQSDPSGAQARVRQQRALKRAQTFKVMRGWRGTVEPKRPLNVRRGVAAEKRFGVGKMGGEQNRARAQPDVGRRDPSHG